MGVKVGIPGKWEPLKVKEAVQGVEKITDRYEDLLTDIVRIRLN
jgi:hypothetical protein